jgi:hypothetical protein
LREAKVINTTDPEELGRIQLKVSPELAEIPDADCPKKRGKSWII